MEITRTDIRRYRVISIIIVVVGIFLVMGGLKGIGYPVIALGLYFLFAPFKVTQNKNKAKTKQSTNMKKEMYINRLTNVFREVYLCGDMAAIECLRRNYTTKELKKILQDFIKYEEQGILDNILIDKPPFKDDPGQVKYYDDLHKGN